MVDDALANHILIGTVIFKSEVNEFVGNWFIFSRVKKNLQLSMLISLFLVMKLTFFPR